MDLQEKVKTILGLASGKIKPEDIRPKKLVMCMNSDDEGNRIETTYFINGEVVTSDEISAQFNKQFVQDDESTLIEVIVDGLSTSDPDYVKKLIELRKSQGRYRVRQIGVNNWETY